MKIALAQLNYLIGNFESNAQKIITTSKEAKKNGADLVVFSELSVCGYCPDDLLYRTDFIDGCNAAVEKIIAECADIPIIIGAPLKHTSGKVNQLFNAALFIANGDVKSQCKTILPNANEINEHRYFDPSDKFDLINLNGVNIALTVGNDVVDYPMDMLAKLNPDFIINISAVQYAHNDNHLSELSQVAKKYCLPLLNVNQVGANTNLIYEGRSIAFNENGKVIAECKSFEEDLQYVETKSFKSAGEELRKMDTTESIFRAITLGLRDYFAKMNFKTAVLGLSGGIDSAVVLALAVNALGRENVHSILMPTCYSSSHSVDDSLEMLKRTKSSYNIIPIEDLRNAFGSAMAEAFEGTKPGLAEENIQARLRGSILMAYSNKFGNILLNTSNKSEEAVGYSTLYGDMCGSLSLLGDVYKTEVYRLARYINEHCGNIIPQNIIDKAPSAELRPDQKDQDSLPPYDILDGILNCYLEGNMTTDEIKAKGFDAETVDFVLKLVTRVEYKRFQAPPILKVSTCAFGHSQSVPLVARY
ncbi:MAG: NAD+ synthase [Bacteroidales bacterium]|nr:NAD+ synthase [Bacteroidales bacterium]